MKKYSDKTRTLLLAIAWTISAILFITLTIVWGTTLWHVLISVNFTFEAIIWWIRYAKKRQEENKHE